MMRQQFVSRRTGRKEGGRWVRPQLERLEEREVLDATTVGNLGFLTAVSQNVAVLTLQAQQAAQHDAQAITTDLGQLAQSGVTGAVQLVTDLNSFTQDLTTIQTLNTVENQLTNVFVGNLASALFTPGALSTPAELSQALLDFVAVGASNNITNMVQGTANSLLANVLQVFSATGQSPFSITGVVQGGSTGLEVTGTILGQHFTAPLTVTASPNPDPAMADCPILDLTLGPINLDLLGLNVATTPICLTVTAIPGNGNLLGNLLCDVGNLLNTGTPLSSILGTLGGTGGLALTGGGTANLPTLTGALNGLLGGALNSALLTGLLNASSTAAPTDADEPPNNPRHTKDTANTCEILNLSLGPVNLNVLGLNVHLDDCHGGPVIVDVDAIPSKDAGGGLLGDLLCGVANLLNTNPLSTTGQLTGLETALASLISGL